MLAPLRADISQVVWIVAYIASTIRSCRTWCESLLRLGAFGVVLRFLTWRFAQVGICCWMSSILVTTISLSMSGVSAPLYALGTATMFAKRDFSLFFQFLLEILSTGKSIILIDTSYKGTMKIIGQTYFRFLENIL